MTIGDQYTNRGTAVGDSGMEAEGAAIPRVIVARPRYYRSLAERYSFEYSGA